LIKVLHFQIKFVSLIYQKRSKMTTLKNSKENNTLVAALKKIAETKWVGNTVHDNLDKCLTAINLETGKNSGWFSPVAVRIDGLAGYYLVNQDGSFCFDYRVIKVDSNKFVIETMTMSAYNEFETIYSNLINE
jgi:hypothetical protein